MTRRQSGQVSRIRTGFALVELHGRNDVRAGVLQGVRTCTDRAAVERVTTVEDHHESCRSSKQDTDDGQNDSRHCIGTLSLVPRGMGREKKIIRT